LFAEGAEDETTMSRTTTVPAAVMPPEVWAREQFGAVRLGDLRLSKRAVKVAAAMAADPAGSIPRQGGGRWKHTKGAYRLFDHDRVTFESLSASHWEATRRAATRRAAGQPAEGGRTGEGRTVLLIQDTTWLDYADHPATAGLGWAGRNAKKGKPRGGSGLFLHTVLAAEPVRATEGGRACAGRVLGLAWGKLWARDHEGPLNSDQKSRSKRRRADDRESLRWEEAITQVGSPPADAGADAPPVRWIHVGDREADIFSLYATARRTGVGFVVRVKQDRSALSGHGEHEAPPTLSREARKDCGLKALCRDQDRLPMLGKTRVWVAPRGGRRGRWAHVTVSGGPVTLYSPQLSRTGHALRVWAVRVFEPDPPWGQKALEWMLLTDRPVESPEDALEVAGWYALRWLVEEFFHCLKTGCRVEERQLESAGRLSPLIGMLCAVAARLLALKCDARLTPDRPASDRLEPEVVQTLARLIEADPQTLTVGRFFVEVARLGGHLARKRDGPPGWKTLWHGWQKLTLIHQGYRMGREGKGCG
jgi:hypothetical protein